ncbi:hypothetical protein F5Y16DRAFT_3809 [Xylariaceae sp. FL0255]|nr:hypothetical protein F5Y16DRAFT_3809 [Xylariaceae sp. FL0255]
MSAPEVSHGRGGAGNITPDNTEYVDGEVTRQGKEGPHGDGPYSTGRGGAANIADDNTAPAARADADVIPVEAIRPSVDEDHHTGRGGAGNEVHIPKPAEEAPHHKAETNTPNQGLADKLKYKLFKAFKK